MSEKKFHTNDLYNQILFESHNFRVIPSIGALVQGWLLIIPKEHYISMGTIKDMNLQLELEELISKVGSIVKQEYGEYIVFENGAYCKDKLVGCGVDYAHIHILPTKIDIINSLENDSNIKYDWKEINNISACIEYINHNKPYLLIQDQQKKIRITTDDNIPSQLFRKVIANSLNLAGKYDWKQYPFIDNVIETINVYKKYNRLLTP